MKDIKKESLNFLKNVKETKKELQSKFNLYIEGHQG